MLTSRDPESFNNVIEKCIFHRKLLKNSSIEFWNKMEFIAFQSEFSSVISLTFLVKFINVLMQSPSMPFYSMFASFFYIFFTAFALYSRKVNHGDPLHLKYKRIATQKKTYEKKFKKIKNIKRVTAYYSLFSEFHNAQKWEQKKLARWRKLLQFCHL